MTEILGWFLFTLPLTLLVIVIIIISGWKTTLAIFVIVGLVAVLSLLGLNLIK